MAALILLACGVAGDCERMSGKGREECRYEQVRELQGDALRAALHAIPEDASRDVLLLRLAVDHPERAGALCALARTDAGRDKCDKVLGRPHLGGTR